MFSFLRFKNIYPINPKISDYCMKSKNDSIRKITEKYNEVVDLKKYIEPCLSIENPSLPNNKLIISLLCFLSTSSFLYYFIFSQNKNMFSFIRYIDVSRK